MDRKYGMLAKRYGRLKELTTIMQKLRVSMQLSKVRDRDRLRVEGGRETETDRGWREGERQRQTEGGGKETETDRGWLEGETCLLYTSPSPRDASKSRMPSSA